MRKTKILAFALAVIMVFSMVSVFASAAFELTTSSELTAMKDAGTIAYSRVGNYEASGYDEALLHNGSNSNCYIYVFDGKATKLKTGVTTRQNIFWDENEKALLLTKYDTVRQQVTYKGVNYESTVRSVAIDGDHKSTYTAGKEVYLNADMTAFVEAGTDGAIPAYVTANATYSKGKTTVSVAVGEAYFIYDADAKTLTPANKGDEGAVAVAFYSDDNNNGVYSTTKYTSVEATNNGDILNYVYVNTITIKHVKGQSVGNIFTTVPSAACGWATGQNSRYPSARGR